MENQPANRDVPGAWYQWRGAVDQNLVTLNREVKEIKTDLKGMPADIEARLTKVVNGKKNNPSNVTFKYLFDKIALPLLLIGIGVVVGILF